MHNLLLFDHLYRVRFLTKFFTHMKFPWITNRKWNGLCFYHIYIGYILVETRCWGIQTQWCCSVGHFAMGGLIHSCFVKKFTVATTSLWSCSKKKFANWTNLTMMKTNCHHLHHVVSWVWKLLINIKILVRSLHYQHQELLKLCHKINQDKHTHKSKSFPTPSITYTRQPPSLHFKVYASEFISVMTMSFEKYFAHHLWNDKNLIIEMLIPISQGDDWSWRSNNCLNCILKRRQPWLLYLLL
jgi:hypothetical protein